MQKETNQGEGLSLADRLLSYSRSGAYPMHMPGHKRNSPFPWMEPLAAMDITEIPGFDNLHGAQGILQEGMERMARLWGSRRSFFLVNGSTCGILAAMASLTRPGDRILMARGSHRSVYHGVELRRLRPVYLQAGTDPETGMLESIRPEQVEAAVQKHPDLRLAVITSPTYEGVISDIAGIRQVLHRRGIPLLVDEAHGAHLGFSPAFSGGAVQAGADIVIHSLHKTLPSLTQTAAAHVCGDLADPEALARQLSVFETSSPSYLLMASLDSCVRLLEREGAERFAGYERRLQAMEEQVKGLRHLRVLGGLASRAAVGEAETASHPAPGTRSHPGFWAKDPGKLVLLPPEGAQGGVWLARQLRERFGIEVEMALDRYALAMTSLCDPPEALDRLANAMIALDREWEEGARGNGAEPSRAAARQETDGRLVPGGAASPEPLPKRQFWSWEAWERPREAVKRQEAGGRVAAGYLWAYPPGIPLLVPGETVTAAMLARWAQMEQAGVELFTTSGEWGKGRLMCLKNG